MLYGLLISFYVFTCILLVLIVLIQKGKSSMGLGNLGGSTQMLFGGSGGQDILQKITWTLGIIFMTTSLLLALVKSSQSKSFRYVRPATTQFKSTQSKAEPIAAPDTPLVPIQSHENPKEEKE